MHCTNPSAQGEMHPPLARVASCVDERAHRRDTPEQVAGTAGTLMSAFWAFTEHGAAGDFEGVALGGADALRKLVEVRVAVLVAVDGTQGAHSAREPPT